METFKDEIKNLKAITRVIAACVLANFVIIALVVGPDSVDSFLVVLYYTRNFIIGVVRCNF